MAFVDAFDMSYVVKRDLEQLIGRKPPLTIVTDSLSLFNVITRASITIEKRLMIDLETVNSSISLLLCAPLGVQKKRNRKGRIYSYWIQPSRRLDKGKELYCNE